jgi:hypothetical protein
MPRLAAALASMVLLLTGCGRESDGPEGLSIDMRPGSDCLSCHAGSGEAPRFVAAGTVVRPAGASGLAVSVTVDGVVRTTSTSSSGNFALAHPGGAGVVTAAAVNGVAMPAGSGITGHCDGCHSGGVHIP